jgi:glycosyltransferase involved in cell wall biosynthesis
MVPPQPSPRLCFVGLMTGRHRGYLTSQGLILAAQLSLGGQHAVITTSGVKNRYLRLIDILRTLVACRRDIDVQCLEVYGGPSMVVEDLASALGKLLGQRIVMVLHGGALPDFMARFPRWTRSVLNRADILVAPSPYLQRAVGKAGFRVRVIPNVLNLNEYPFRERRRLMPRLFWMRSFHPIWNPEMAVRVLARVRVRFPDATLVLAGQDKGTELAVRQLATDLGVADAVRFPGFLDMPAKIREAAACDIFLNTNRIDNMPVALVEAGALGLPVISTRVGGIPDLLTHEETGLLVDDGDDRQMAAAVERLLGDEELAQRLSVNGRRLAERSAWTAVQPQWERLFQELALPSEAAAPVRA